MSAPMREAGHTVLAVHPPPGLHSLQELLAKHTFIPDMIFQAETLGPRVIFTDLPALPCPKLFWSVDSHLNMFWHRHYGRLFDCVLSPHISLHSMQPEDWRLPRLARFAKEGTARPFQRHSRRKRVLAFVGRLSGDRGPRRNMLHILASRGLEPLDGLSPEAMLALYDDTRILPNESLCAEVNFRLMEGASCGCCLLTPDVGEDQDALLEPGKECLIYTNGLELLEQIDQLAARPELTEAIGRAAWQRIQAEHLPRHRVAAILREANNAGSAVQGEKAALHLLMCIVQLTRAGIFIEDPKITDARLRASSHPLAFAARVQLASETGQTELCARLLQEALLAGFGANRLDVDGICSFAAIQTHDLGIAKQFWYRYHQNGTRQKAKKPESPYHICLLWAQEYMRRGRLAQPGLPFKPGSCPESALEALLLAGRFAEGNNEWRRLLAGLEHIPRSYPQLYADTMLELDRCAPRNWRTGLRAALALFRICALPEGERVLFRSWNNAAAAGREQAFLTMLCKTPALMRAFETAL
ncbi:MAG: glycosyltransferase [Desulfovibrionaceae bacterium]|nr:glycosyltransferase [Desulfovibrionaceae bacterium]